MSKKQPKCAVCDNTLDAADGSLLCPACRKKARRQTMRLDADYDELTGMIWKKGS